MKNAAIILCAGKGMRMNDDSRNKVCFDCADVPAIKRIIAPRVIRGLPDKTADAVWGVQPVGNNYYGGRAVMRGQKPCGVAELPDAVLMSLEGKNEAEYESEIGKYRLNEKRPGGAVHGPAPVRSVRLFHGADRRTVRSDE